MKTWFITDASRGFGRIWVEAALTRGDKVAATARKSADVAGPITAWNTNCPTGTSSDEDGLLPW